MIKNSMFTLLSLCCLQFFVMAGLSIPVSHITPLLPHWGWGIGIAVALCIAAAVSHTKCKGWTPGYLFSYLLNALGSGIAIGILYGETGWTPTPMGLLMGCAAPAILGFILCMGTFAHGKPWFGLFHLICTILSALLIIAFLAFWICSDKIIGSFGFFSSTSMLLFHILCPSALDHPEGKWRYLSQSGFWAFGIIVIVVVLILSDGSVFDGLDFDLPSRKKKSKTCHKNGM